MSRIDKILEEHRRIDSDLAAVVPEGVPFDDEKMREQLELSIKNRSLERQETQLLLLAELARSVERCAVALEDLGSCVSKDYEGTSFWGTLSISKS